MIECNDNMKNQCKTSLEAGKGPFQVHDVLRLLTLWFKYGADDAVPEIRSALQEGPPPAAAPKVVRSWWGV